jgi:hypothetical protein
MDEETAFEVEAALIDAYPEANNLMGGQASEDRGCMHAKQIIERYEAKEVVFRHSAILINVNKSAIERDNIYEAVRYAWRLDPKKAQQAEVVLAVDRGLVIGVFIAEKWLPATCRIFPLSPRIAPDDVVLWDITPLITSPIFIYTTVFQITCGNAVLPTRSDTQIRSRRKRAKRCSKTDERSQPDAP